MVDKFVFTQESQEDTVNIDDDYPAKLIPAGTVLGFGCMEDDCGTDIAQVEH